MGTGSWKRRSLRRAVGLECALQSDLWDGSVSLSAVERVERGRLDRQRPTRSTRGEELVLSFFPPGARRGEEVWAVAEVARVGLWRRRLDPWPPGMGLTFAI